MLADSDVCTSDRTFTEFVLTDNVRDAIGELLESSPNPVDDIDRSLTWLRIVFAALPIELLQGILDFGRHVDTAGVALVRNLPVDPVLPATPVNGEPSALKRTFVAEGVLLGLSQLLGEPVGVTTEKGGRLVHDVVPVSTGAMSQTNQSSAAFLNFHSDIVYDDFGRFDLPNPDFLVLNCLRQDRNAEAVTYYADARDVIGDLPADVVQTLRTPQFRLNAPGSYVRDHAGGAAVLSDPIAIISGPPSAPGIVVSANGVVGLTGEADASLAELQRSCRAVAHEVRLERGTALLINNRKGLHARSQFLAQHDGQDRWLQRTYLRRSLWDIRYRSTADSRRVH